MRAALICVLISAPPTVSVNESTQEDPHGTTPRIVGGDGRVTVGGRGGAGAAIASAATTTPTDRPITGAALRAGRAGGAGADRRRHVTETEVGDEESYYEVEVTLATAARSTSSSTRTSRSSAPRPTARDEPAGDD